MVLCVRPKELAIAVKDTQMGSPQLQHRFAMGRDLPSLPGGGVMYLEILKHIV